MAGLDRGGRLIDGFTYGPQSADVSFGFLPEDSDAPEYLATPTPGGNNALSDPFSMICINEFFTASHLNVPDWIEVHNRGAAVVDIGGWHLSDDSGSPDKYTFLPGSILDPGEFRVLTEDVLGFALAFDGSEELVLTDTDAATGKDYFDFGPQLHDVSQGRLPDGTANWHFTSGWTAGNPNSCGSGSFALDPVERLVFVSSMALAWDETSDAEGYDAVVGNLAQLRDTGGAFDQAAVECLENNSSDASTWSPSSPASGGGFFYVIRAVDRSCGFGSYDSGSPSQAGSRDDGTSNSSATCP